jgi:hypothetical protein
VFWIYSGERLRGNIAGTKEISGIYGQANKTLRRRKVGVLN